jgi:hypothetical protein
MAEVDSKVQHLQWADHCRRMAEHVSDASVAERLMKLAEKFERDAGVASITQEGSSSDSAQ